MGINIADVTFHIDENIGEESRKQIEDMLRGQHGVITVDNHKETAHLIIVGYNPDETHAKDLLQAIKAAGVHAEAIGL